MAPEDAPSHEHSEPTSPFVLPDADVRKIDDAEFSILIERIKMDDLYDQSREMQMGQGCISKPTGPGC